MVVSVYQLKPRFQSLLRPALAFLAHAGVTANQVTVAALLLSAAFGLSIAWFAAARWPLLLLPLALLARMALNAIDGMLAREYGMKSSLGAILNELGDVLSDTVLYLPLGFLPGIEPAWLIAVVTLAILSEMTGVLAVMIGAPRCYDGPMGRSDRAFVFGLVGLLMGLEILPARGFDYAMMAMLLLLTLTIFNRARHALREAA
ncbi:MAG: CDP-alcohol phosphatidyltransferase family protein [Deltaproteobacteria bacterium]|nr:CDP-alcohol phosphatidyltransferase family protein [Deltaproteobacteria bacterium]